MKINNQNRNSYVLLLYFFVPILVAVLASLGLVVRASSRLNLLSTHFKSFHPSTQPLTKSAPLTMTSYSKELRIASLAVQRAALLTQKVFHNKVKGTELKGDKSPVTIGDYGAQALIIAAIKHNFPNDTIVGEEDSSSLRENESIRSQVWNAVKDTRLLGSVDDELGGPIKDEDTMLAAIDAGNSTGGPKGRFWALDPIDGTKGFLRGGQYAVCLALIVDGEIELGVLGCPNLPVDDKAPLSAEVTDKENHQRGVLFAAVRGQGATSQPLGSEDLESSKPIHMKSPSLSDATFCESVEAGHSSHGDQATIARKLGITKPSVRMDSQSKYGSVARGAGDIYLRLPISATYEEKIWDHAAGVLIVAEAGGVVTDSQGKKLDFSVGRTLKNNKGVVAAPKDLHPEIIKVVIEVLAAKD
jgi:3'(2'), 5'-bisphosphate nucleotidase